MLSNLLRSARVMTLRAQLWWLGQRMEMQMATPPVKRRRRKAVTQPEVVAPTELATCVDDPDGLAMGIETVKFFAAHPLMEGRRRHFSPAEVTQLLADSLLKRGMPHEILIKTRWMWVGGKHGCPELYLILPGIEA